MAEINELVSKFSFIGSLKPQESFNKNLGASVKLLAGVGASIIGAAAGFATWTSSIAQSIDPMVQLSRETGETIATIQELGFAASQNGSSLDAVQSSIRELTKRAGEFARTGGGSASEAFLQLGVSVRNSNGDMKTASQIMTELSGTLQGFNKGEQADILDKLGIDPSMIQLLNQSSSEMAALREEARALGTITQEQADAAASLNDANTTLKFGLTGLRNTIGVGLAPIVQGITEGFIDFLVAHKDLIANGVKMLGEAIVILGGFIRRIAPFVLVAAAAFGVWTLATGGLATVMGLLISPVVIISAGILALALIVDDLVVAFNGGDSVIGGFIERLTGFDIGEGMRNAAASIKEFISISIDSFKSLFNFIGNFSFSGIWDGLLNSFLAVFDNIKKIFTDFTSSISFGGAFDSLKSSLGFNNGKDGASGASAQPLGFRGGNNGAIDKGTTNNSSSNSNVEQNNNINVYSSDPMAAGKSVSDVQSNNLREARQYFDRGGL
jgi:hypothetical protein